MLIGSSVSAQYLFIINKESSLIKKSVKKQDYGKIRLCQYKKFLNKSD